VNGRPEHAAERIQDQFRFHPLRNSVTVYAAMSTITCWRDATTPKDETVVLMQTPRAEGS